VEKFRLTHISPAEKQNLSQGIFILLLNANSVPPHLLLSIEGELYSITDAGRQMGSALKKMLGFIERKKIPALFVEWHLPEDWNVEKMKSEIRLNFLKYEKVVEGKVSCLFPIRDTAVSVLGDEMKNAEFIFELLPLIQKRNEIGKTFALNMENTIDSDGSFELMTYDDRQLNEAIAAGGASIRPAI
jgi:hypothetical protein